MDDKRPLLFAVPKSKHPFLTAQCPKTHQFLLEGRLLQATLDLLSGSDIRFDRKPRSDIAFVLNHEKIGKIKLVFLPAADIPTFVGEGRVDLGITGRDQVAEHEAEHPATEQKGVEEVLNLGFGKCKLQVQVPEKGGLDDPRDLIGKTVVTSFTALTEQYFRALESRVDGASGHQLTNGNASKESRLRTNIIRVSGSVEAACALGVGDGIVDLVGMFTSLARMSSWTASNDDLQSLGRP